jgi:oligopeptide transport system ATP-binding protein
MENLLEVTNLSTSFFTHVGEVKAVRNISFYLRRGEALGIVGESGCGKSVTMLSLMKLLVDTGRIVNGSIMFNGKDIIRAGSREMKRIRGNEIGMIFQDPMTSLNPVLTIENQMIEPLRIHMGMGREQARRKAVELLDLVGIPSPEKRLRQYPHEFSGGMRQRVMIAIALSCQPKLLIADEPTTALDVTIQAQILELLKDIKNRINTSIILITHDLGIVADMCDRVNVMYGGCIIEKGETRDIYYYSRHPYTWGLLGSVPNPRTLARQRLKPIEGQPPDLLKPPEGCPFAPRCGYAMGVCLKEMPPEYEISGTHKAACWLNHPDAPRVAGPLKGGERP